MRRLLVFSALIQDSDRNPGNILITEAWKVWMIDFTRAFRLAPELQSRLAALVLLPLVGGEPRGSQTIERPADTPPESPWFPADRSDRPAFRHNVESLVRLVRADNAIPLLVPFRLEPQHALTAEEANQIDRHAGILEEIAGANGVLLAPFPASTIPPSGWIDDCHLSAEGCRGKAAYLEPFVRRLLERAAASGDR